MLVLQTRTVFATPTSFSARFASGADMPVMAKTRSNLELLKQSSKIRFINQLKVLLDPLQGSYAVVRSHLC
jgi:hypothetical protein